ncbi:hypothetical protein PTSG_04947 [Salpingoeca rosetta]|uniref:RING-type domain-containing protein n=1 Tax=Salpingoeca rosetta (strain ATCC 50818 / BSB-021) TaxID=946362 RepID=F2U928_SALR5|nr:uncharacterized protein PTSG_04947 [Salpingoeca rosetta]EGD73231.1 hypothetical protein PTSG_04947 [Salpingoeca rosetta]|eukprot:XP_004994262.1 hypothetical protein PTSG_04947 [Salpingoeca rosetta]
MSNTYPGVPASSSSSFASTSLSPLQHSRTATAKTTNTTSRATPTPPPPRLSASPEALAATFPSKKASHIVEARSYRRAAVKCLQQSDAISAAHNYNKALGLLRSGSHSLSEEVSMLVDLARTLLKSNHVDEAEPHIRRAHNIISNSDQQPSFSAKLRWSCSFLYGKVSLKRRQHSLAVSLLKDAKRLCREAGDDDAETLRITNITLAQAVCARAQVAQCQPVELVMALDAVKAYLATFQPTDTTQEAAGKRAQAYHVRAMLHRHMSEDEEERKWLHETLVLNEEHGVLSQDKADAIKARFMHLCAATGNGSGQPRDDDGDDLRLYNNYGRPYSHSHPRHSHPHHSNGYGNSNGVAHAASSRFAAFDGYADDRHRSGSNASADMVAESAAHVRRSLAPRFTFAAFDEPRSSSTPASSSSTPMDTLLHGSPHSPASSATSLASHSASRPTQHHSGRLGHFAHPNPHVYALAHADEAHGIRASSVPVTRSSSPSPRGQPGSQRKRSLHNFPRSCASHTCIHSPELHSPRRVQSSANLSPSMGSQQLSSMSTAELRRLQSMHHAAVRDIQDAIVTAEKRSAYADGKAMVINCKVCLENKVSVCSMPCRHACLCASCAEQITECPVCREPVQSTMSIFL